MVLVVHRSDPRRVYVAGHNIFTVSDDGGANWQPVRHNLPPDDIYGFAPSPQASDRLYAFVVGHGLFVSADGGKSWRLMGMALP